MKNLIFTTVSLFAMIAIYAYNNPRVDFSKNTDSGIQFHQGNFSAALELAKKEKKLIFLDIYATWCGPCKKLKANTFSNNEVGAFYNKTFINVALDGELGEGLDLSRKYGVKGYPTLLFIDGDGKIVSSASGYHSPAEIISLGKSINGSK